MFAAVQYGCVDNVATIAIDYPPVNALSTAVRSGLLGAFRLARDDSDARAIILTGKGKGFCAGGDIREFGTPSVAAPPGLSMQVHPFIESMNKPVIAAIHGLAIGGGLETALVCHYRVVEADARIGLPEVGLGTIPLSGTQRMPRAVGLIRAIGMILSASLAPASSFAGTALFDRIVEPGQALDAAMQLAHALVERNDLSLPLIRHRAVSHRHATRVLAHARAALADGPTAHAAVQALEAIAASVASDDFDTGMQKARALYDTLMASDEVRIQRERFFNRS
ncbi:enoyl-CoA hydratase/isomerase family protein [Paraburkholderia sediminicola]|uniref:enoyl-CoA hydratase/isomerase family protein n=1 Tax=Paraburkholderia sediminicola TaxID=458836 RepID=UPI0038BD3808